uniref:Oligopeptide transporter 3 n=1 Tax=Cajanus cajan TaxID=3821 RepID=A0A151UD67_CAJCA
MHLLFVRLGRFGNAGPCRQWPFARRRSRVSGKSCTPDARGSTSSDGPLENNLRPACDRPPPRTRPLWRNHPFATPPPPVEERCPVEEVALVVPETDDPSFSVMTFRAWFLGIASCVLLIFLNTFFTFRRSLSPSPPFSCKSRFFP